MIKTNFAFFPVFCRSNVYDAIVTLMVIILVDIDKVDQNLGNKYSII